MICTVIFDLSIAIVIGVIGACSGSSAAGLSVSQMLMLRFLGGALVLWALAFARREVTKLPLLKLAGFSALGLLYVAEAWLYFESSQRIPIALTALPRAEAAPSDVPALWTQTGRLFDSGGAPVVGDIAMAFALYDLPSGGTALWTETHTVTLDDGYFSIVLNTNPYTYLGNRPLDLSPAATLDRGLVVVTFRTMSATAILRSLAGALRGGGVEPSDHLDLRTDLSDLVISHESPFPYQVDGDFLGDTRELRFRHRPDAVRLVRPAPAP